MSRSKRSNEPGHTAAHYSFRGEGRVRSQATSAPAVSTGNGTIRLGTRVRLCGNNVTVYGRVKRFIPEEELKGRTRGGTLLGLKNPLWCGVELELQLADDVISKLPFCVGKLYRHLECAPGYGIFAPVSKCTRDARGSVSTDVPAAPEDVAADVNYVGSTEALQRRHSEEVNYIGSTKALQRTHSDIVSQHRNTLLARFPSAPSIAINEALRRRPQESALSAPSAEIEAELSQKYRRSNK